MKMLVVLMFAAVLLCQRSSAQELVLQKTARTIASANPDIIEFSFTVSLPIDVPGANLTESTSPSLIVGNYSTDGSITSTGSGVVTFTFNTTLQNDTVILSYNVTLLNGGENFSGFVNLTSTITYYTTSFMNETKTSTATVCIGKSERLNVSYTNQNWYIALTVLCGFLVGAAIAVAIASVCWKGPSRSSGTSASGAGNMKDNEAGYIDSTRSGDFTDLSQVVQSDDILKSNHLLELCEIETLTSVEYRLLQEKAEALWSIHTSTSKIRRAEGKGAKEIKEEIKRKSDEVSEANQESLEKERIKNDTRKSYLTRKHELEKEKLLQQISMFDPETHHEMSTFLETRQSIEAKHEDHLATLRLKEAERRGGHPHEIACQLLADGLRAAQGKTDYSSKHEDVHELYMKRIAAISDINRGRTRTLTTWRKREISKINSYESSIRSSWNRFGKSVIEAIKTVCRELELDAKVRKDIVGFVKEEMVKLKRHFDAEKDKMRAEFFKTCQSAKPKYLAPSRKNQQRKYFNHDTDSKWLESTLSKTDEDISHVLTSQIKYDTFVLNEWNSKFQVVLQGTSDMMKAMKDKVVDQLAHQGASRTLVSEFFESETKYENVDKPETVAPLQFTVESTSEDDNVTSNMAMLCYQQALKTFCRTQPFPVDESKIQIDFEPVHHLAPNSANHSLQRIRQLIEYHAKDIEMRNTVSKIKKRKRGTARLTEEELRRDLETRLQKWQDKSSVLPYEQPADRNEHWEESLINDEKLADVFNREISAQWNKKSQLELLNLDLNALERLMMVLVQFLVSERKISPSEANTVLQQRRIQAEALQNSSSTRSRRKLDQVTRRRLTSPQTVANTQEYDPTDAATAQVMHHLNANKAIAKNGLRRIVEDTEVAKEKFEVLSQLNEQQASEMRDLDLKVIQALARAAKVPYAEMSACFTLLLHHRKRDEIDTMMRTVFMGERDQATTETILLTKIREMLAHQKHRIAENILRTDDDFTPTPLHSSNRLQRIKQPHHVTFSDGSPSRIRRDQLSPLPDIRPEPDGRTSTPDHSYEFGRREDNSYREFDKPMKPSRRRKKKSLKNLSVAK